MRLTVIALSCCVLVAACSDPEKVKKEHFDNATRYMAEGKTQEAIVEYRNAIQADAKYGEARLKLSEAYQAAGNVNQAYREAVRAADLLPQNNDAQTRATEYLMAAGRFEDARTRVQPVIDRDPSNVNAQLLLGRALVGLKDLDGAVREIEEAIKLAPDRGMSYSSLAAVRMAQGDREKAGAAFQKAVEVDPRSVGARLALAYYQWAAGDMVATDATFKAALALDPKNVLANRAIVAFYLANRRAPEAEPYLKALVSLGAPNAPLQLADYYAATGRRGEAAAVLEPLVKERATAGVAEVRLAALAYENNEKSKAHGLLDAVIKREPNNVQALVIKTQWLLVEDKAPEALTSAQAAAKADPRSTPARYYLGVVYDRLRQRKEAMAEFTEALRLNPRAVAAQVQLSRLNLVDGSPDAAVTFAENALSNAPASPEARLSLVRGLLARRDTARAAQELLPLIKQFPNVGTVHAVDGTLKAQQKDMAGARAAFERALALAPNSVEALAGLTTMDIFEKKMPQARARVEARLAAEPKRADYLMLAAQVYGMERNFPKAEAALRQAIQNDSTSSRAYSMLAGVLLASGKLDAARAEFDQIAQRDTSNVAAQTMAAMIVQSQNKTADATKRYETIVNMDPTAAVAANNLAWLYAEGNDKLDEALRLAQGAAARLPDSAEVQDTIGWIYYKKELPVLAIAAFEKSVEKSPETPLYHLHLAQALLKSGDKRRASEAAATAIKLRPDYAEAQKVLAEAKG